LLLLVNKVSGAAERSEVDWLLAWLARCVADAVTSAAVGVAAEEIKPARLSRLDSTVSLPGLLSALLALNQAVGVFGWASVFGCASPALLKSSGRAEKPLLGVLKTPTAVWLAMCCCSTLWGPLYRAAATSPSEPSCMLLDAAVAVLDWRVSAEKVVCKGLWKWGSEAAGATRSTLFQTRIDGAAMAGLLPGTALPQRWSKMTWSSAVHPTCKHLAQINIWLWPVQMVQSGDKPSRVRLQHEQEPQKPLLTLHAGTQHMIFTGGTTVW